MLLLASLELSHTAVEEYTESFLTSSVCYFLIFPLLINKITLCLKISANHVWVTAEHSSNMT